MKKIILLISILLANFSYAQEEQGQLQLITKGAHILALQFHDSKKPHQAKILAKFLSLIDKDSAQTKNLIEMIKTSAQIRINSRLKDNGRQYAEFLYKNGPELPDTIQTKDKKILVGIVCTSLNNNSPAKKLLNNPDIINSNNFYKDLFPITNSLNQPMLPLQAFQEAVLPSFRYNSTEFLKAINFINYHLRNTGTQLKFRITADKKGTKAIIIDSIDDSKGYIIYRGSSDMTAQGANITMENTKLRDFLNYIEHTTGFDFKLNTPNKHIEIVDAKNGTSGRPQNFKIKKTLVRDINESLVNAQLKFGNKSMQIKGLVTKTQDSDAKYYIELDGTIIVEVDKKRLVDNGQSLIEQQLKDSLASGRPFELIVRGRALIKSAKTIYIKECYSVLSESSAFFYTKSATK